MLVVPRKKISTCYLQNNVWNVLLWEVKKKKSFTILKCVHLNHILKHKLESSK